MRLLFSLFLLHCSFFLSAQTIPASVDREAHVPFSLSEEGTSRDTPENLVGFTQTGTALIVYTDEGDSLWIQAYRPDIVGVEYMLEGYVPPPSYSVVLEPDPDLPLVVTESADTIYYSVGNLEVQIDKSGLFPHFFWKGEWVAQQFLSNLQPNGAFSIQMTDEGNSYQGLGSRTDHRLQGSYSIYNQAQYGYDGNATNLNITTPFALSSAGYGVFWDNHWDATINIVGQFTPQLTYQASGGAMRSFLLFGDTPGEVIEDVSLLTGRQPLPPRWALGYIQSRFGYEYESEARGIVEDMLAADFPLDALVLDLYWFGEPGDMGNLDWDYNRFPNPVEMIQDFEDLGVKTILITEPYVTEQSTNFDLVTQNEWVGTDPQGNPQIVPNFWAGPAVLLDLFKPEALDWFWERYDVRIQEGIAGWWCDLGEPEVHPDDMQFVDGSAVELHNVYSLEWARFLHDRYREHYPEQRLFNLIRSGFSGMQRYQTFPWSGDVSRTISGFEAQMPIMRNMGISGVGYMHSDAGGFAGSQSDELYQYWLQQSAFSPIMRPHGSGEPTEPIFYPASVQQAVRKYAKLRRRMLPYNYTLAWENTTQGKPLVRPPYYDLEWDAVQAGTGYEGIYEDLADLGLYSPVYLWGPNLLIAPRVDLVASTPFQHLGRWINWHTDETYFFPDYPEPALEENYSWPEGEGELTVLAKEGAFVPMVPDFPTMDDYSTQHLLMHYFPGQLASVDTYTLFEDDGKNPYSLEDSLFQLLGFSGFIGEDTLSIHFTREGSYPDGHDQRQLEFILHRMDTVYHVWFDSIQLTEYTSWTAYQNAEQGYFYDIDKYWLWVKVDWENPEGWIHLGDFDLIVNPVEVSQQNVGVSPNWNLSPNPTREVVLVSWEDVVVTRVRLLDLNGRKIRSFQPDDSKLAGQLEIPLLGLPAGMYWVSMEGPGWVDTQRLVKVE
jgi:oligosaccharide 4-alpha-D-glucosyltransferase